MINTETLLMVVLHSGEEVKQTLADDVESSSSDDNDNVHDESQYRITVPLDVRHVAPPPVFATPALPAAVSSTLPSLLISYPSLPISHPPLLVSNASLPALLPAVAVCTPQLAVHQVMHPMMTVATGPVGPMSMPTANIASGPVGPMSLPPANITTGPVGPVSVSPANIPSGAVDLRCVLPPNVNVQHRPSLAAQLHHPQQQLMLPVTVPPAPVLRQPRCRDYDGEYVCVCVCTG